MAKITAPQKGYNGVSVGVRFEDGVGETDNEAAIAYFERQGYTVEGSDPDAGAEDEAEQEIVDPLGAVVETQSIDPNRDAADPRNDAVPVGGVKGDGLIVAGRGKGKRVSKTQPAPAPEPGSVVAGVQETGDPENQSANPSSPNPPEATTPVDAPTTLDDGKPVEPTPAPEDGALKQETSTEPDAAPAETSTTDATPSTDDSAKAGA
jgi:hypothetical protein